MLDGAITVLDAQSGVEPQTENVWRQATTYGVPRLVFVNKMDKIGADFDYSLSTLHDRLQANAHAVQLPIGAEDKFEGVIDLIEMKADLYDEDELGTKWDTVDIPDEYKEAAEKAHNELVEAVADVDDGIMDKYLEGEEISNAELKAAIRKATINLESIRFWLVQLSRTRVFRCCWTRLLITCRHHWMFVRIMQPILIQAMPLS